MMTDALLGNFGLFQPKVERHPLDVEDLNLIGQIKQHVHAMEFLRKKLKHAKKDMVKAKLHKARLYELEKERKSGLYDLAQQFLEGSYIYGSYLEGSYRPVQESDQLDVINTELSKAIAADIKESKKYYDILHDIEKYSVEHKKLVVRRIDGFCKSYSEIDQQQQEQTYQPPALR